MVLRVKDAARLFQVDQDAIYLWIEKRNLPAHRVKGEFRFYKEELLEWATNTGTAVSSEFIETDTNDAQNIPGLLEALTAGGIFYNVKSPDKESVLKSVVSLIPLPQSVDKTFLFQVLWARESLSSTGIGDGIAIPHPRTPIVLNVDKPLVSLLFLENPVDFGSLDGKPVHSLFTIICPTVRIHLNFLSSLAFMLHNKSFKECLKRRDPSEKILEYIKNFEKLLSVKRQVTGAAKK
jgi:PTS system nitrogen regulatory IIA component